MQTLGSWPLPVFRLEEYLGRWEFAVRHNLTASDVESWTLADLLAGATPEQRQSWDEQWLGYIPSNGLLELRQAIAATYEDIEADQVLVFSGAEEGLFCVMQALLDRDSHAIVTVPNYQAMEELPLALCGNVSGLPLRAENGWDIDFDELARLWQPNTRLLAVNFPNNPTGKLIRPERWEQLWRFAQDRGAWLLSDEVYRGLERRPEHRLRQAADCFAQGISLNVMSKAYGLPGLRIGWVACPDRALLSRLEHIKHYLTICNSAPSERLATLALLQRDRLLERNRQLVNGNLQRFREFLQRWPEHFHWHEPEGACVGFVRRLTGPSQNWCERLVEEQGVLFLSAAIFRSSLAEVPEDHFRVGFGRANFESALGHWEDVLRGQRG